MVRTVSIDDFGNRFEHAQSFISDTAAPRLLEAPAAQLFVHAPIDLSWTIDDEDSGVASAQIERRIGSGAWAPVGTPLSAPMGPGASVTLSTQYAPLVEGVLEGSVVAYRVRAWDKAGNPLDLAATTVTTLADYSRPIVTGIFLDTNPQDVTTRPYSRWRITFDDAFSGLANLSLTIETDANGLRDSHANTSANGTATIVLEGNLSLALHELAWLNATATDRAGNTFQLASLAQAAHEIPPIIDLTMPKYGRSWLVGTVEVRLVTSIPDHPSLAPDWTSLTLANATWSQEIANQTGTNSIVVTTDLSALAGDYNLIATSEHGRAGSQATLPVSLVQGTNLELVALDTLSTLPTTTSAHEYHLEHHSNCDGTQFRITVESLAGSDVDVYLKHHSASSWQYAATSTVSHEEVVYANAVPGQLYNIRVETKAASASYYIRYGTPDCGGKEGTTSEEILPEEFFKELT